MSTGQEESIEEIEALIAELGSRDITSARWEAMQWVPLELERPDDGILVMLQTVTNKVGPGYASGGKWYWERHVLVRVGVRYWAEYPIGPKV